MQARAPGAFVAVAFPPARYAAHLRALMPKSFRIGSSKINQAQLLDHVVDPATGIVFSRPDKWR